MNFKKIKNKDDSITYVVTPTYKVNEVVGFKLGDGSKLFIGKIIYWSFNGLGINYTVECGSENLEIHEENIKIIYVAT